MQFNCESVEMRVPENMASLLADIQERAAQNPGADPVDLCREAFGAGASKHRAEFQAKNTEITMN